MEEKLIGRVVHYFTRLGVAGIELTDTLRVGDIVHIRGHTSDFAQRAGSIEINRQPVNEAHAGALIGLLVAQRARVGDRVYKVIGEDKERILLGELDEKESDIRP